MQPEGAATAAHGVEWAKIAVAASPSRAWYLHTLALAHYRSGQFELAMKVSNESLTDARWAGIPVNWLLSAMINRRLGQPEEAQRWRRQAVR
jgi:hypothetical protein